MTLQKYSIDKKLNETDQIRKTKVNVGKDIITPKKKNKS